MSPISTPQHLIPEIIAGEENWVIWSIVESQQNKRKRGQPVEYLVLWEGYPNKDATWELWEHIQGTAEEVLAEFYYKYPDTPIDTYQSQRVQNKQS